jgi:hypothetical protein
MRHFPDVDVGDQQQLPFLPENGARRMKYERLPRNVFCNGHDFV